MDRDPENRDCTRDPIYLFQSVNRQWTAIPDGLEVEDSETWRVDDENLLDDWIRPFIEWDEPEPGDDESSTRTGCLIMSEAMYAVAEKREQNGGWPLVHVSWTTEAVFLTRPEAEEFGNRRTYRWDKWRVYCVPCEGELARILKEYKPAGELQVASDSMSKAAPAMLEALQGLMDYNTGAPRLHNNPHVDFEMRKQRARDAIEQAIGES